MNELIQVYISKWSSRGYPEDIPDSVPDELMRLNLAPSYKAIAMAILKNDTNFHSLGSPIKKSIYYNVLKKIEIENRVIKNEK